MDSKDTEKTPETRKEHPKGRKPQDLLTSIGSAAADTAKNAAASVSGSIANLGGHVTEKARNITASVVSAVDQNGNGEIDIADFVLLAMKLPGIRVDRAGFLRSELQKKFPPETVNQAIAERPVLAGIPAADLDKAADHVIAYERNCVAGISAGLGLPGGFAMAATVPVDITQYFGYMLRAAQKLMYLYGFPALDLKNGADGAPLDSETMNVLILCLGAAYGAVGADKAVKAIAQALANGVEKKLLNAALTKGTIYPIVKSVAKWFGVKMTKKVFAGFFKKAIPVIGGVVGGTITFATFGPCCKRLQDTLQHTYLSDPEGAEDPGLEIMLDDSALANPEDAGTEIVPDDSALTGPEE